jgi:SPP1 family predicted phage head-tail adaptor
MKAGQLRHRITVETKTVGRDGYGEETVSWSSNIGAWAEIRPLKGMQYYAAQQVQSAISHKIIMRYATLSASTAIGAGYCRINHKGRIFHIEHVINSDERNIYLEIMCKEEIGG